MRGNGAIAVNKEGRRFMSERTTRIGKYILNHSFMIPGRVATGGAVNTGLAIAKVLF